MYRISPTGKFMGCTAIRLSTKSGGAAIFLMIGRMKLSNPKGLGRDSR